MAAASPCATPPAGVPASSRRECGACATRAKSRAVFRLCARRTGTTSASGGASSMPRRRGGSAAARRARRGADLAASMPGGGAVKPRTGDGAPRKVQRVRPQRKARRVPRRNGCSPKAAPRRLDWRPPPGLADNGMRHFHGAWRRRCGRTVSDRQHAQANATRSALPQKLTGYFDGVIRVRVNIVAAQRSQESEVGIQKLNVKALQNVLQPRSSDSPN